MIKRLLFTALIFTTTSLFAQSIRTFSAFNIINHANQSIIVASVPDGNAFDIQMKQSDDKWSSCVSVTYVNCSVSAKNAGQFRAVFSGKKRPSTFEKAIAFYLYQGNARSGRPGSMCLFRHYPLSKYKTTLITYASKTLAGVPLNCDTTNRNKSPVDVVYLGD